MGSRAKFFNGRTMPPKKTSKKAVAAKAPSKPKIDLDNPPKKNLTSYIIFGNERREAVKEANPDAAAKDIMKLLGEEWRDLDDADKAEYTKMAEKDRERYVAELEAFKDSGGVLPEKKTKAAKVKPSYDENLGPPPKKAITAYFFFTMDRRPHFVKANPEFKVTQVAKALGAEWKAMSEAAKQKYVKKAEKDKTRYKKEADAYVAKGGDLKATKKPPKATAAATGAKKGRAAKLVEPEPVDDEDGSEDVEDEESEEEEEEEEEESDE